MAEKRMFAKTIIDSDAFLDMPLSTQALYFHIAMRADDDGFVNNPKRITRNIGANDDELKVLIAKKFLLVFESGVIVIKHWRIHNYIQSDRYKPTIHLEERALLSIEENKAYSLDTVCIHDVSNMEAQISLDKIRPDKNNICAFFESIWYLYPLKKGKGQVSDTQKKKLYAIGIDEMTRAIERYKKENTNPQYWQHGSTFFNSGYIDYLDANFQEVKPKSMYRQTD